MFSLQEMKKVMLIILLPCKKKLTFRKVIRYSKINPAEFHLQIPNLFFGSGLCKPSVHYYKNTVSTHRKKFVGAQLERVWLVDLFLI